MSKTGWVVLWNYSSEWIINIWLMAFTSFALRFLVQVLVIHWKQTIPFLSLGNRKGNSTIENASFKIWNLIAKSTSIIVMSLVPQLIFYSAKRQGNSLLKPILRFLKLSI